MAKKKTESGEVEVNVPEEPTLEPVAVDLEADLQARSVSAVAASMPVSDIVDKCDCGDKHDTKDDLKVLVFPTGKFHAKKSDSECVQKVANKK